MVVLSIRGDVAQKYPADRLFWGKWLRLADDVIIFFKFFEVFRKFFMGPNKVFYVSRSVRRALSISEVRFSIAPRGKGKRQFSTPKLYFRKSKKIFFSKFFFLIKIGLLSEKNKSVVIIRVWPPIEVRPP